ncbi:hypothetical protein EC915_102579 [Pseudomonas sp. LP_7_YM]|nr:hypothetical protein EC915_102579 [Pseudomonas sp. LP_7_YM]
MEYAKYLKSIIPRNEEWSTLLNEVLSSDSLKLGNPYEENVSLLLARYGRRANFDYGSESGAFGLSDLVVRLSSFSLSEKLQVYPMTNDLFDGDCFVCNDEIIGCAFIKQGRAVSREGLWINGMKIE